eukprot:CAMPEP_0206126782 /NCGR_PEP_ID=MMETSP1472-20131121/23877_1 /ASSEMBLY_ACC=CAM_ASM_001108 /TAXON_ID=41880 /ORGANISM="Pycnococcus provasolii, Strain RCC251" /LENGTH=81 /DNA_ID=CAMNT_0053517825 /DNA_START=60 /DNA_END=305 /DNA_ORIENTATION=+
MTAPVAAPTQNASSHDSHNFGAVFSDGSAADAAASMAFTAPLPLLDDSAIAMMSRFSRRSFALMRRSRSAARRAMRASDAR